MVEDERCCGTGTCLINAEGQCWCGQRWDGQKMCFAESNTSLVEPVITPQAQQASQAD